MPSMVDSRMPASSGPAKDPESALDPTCLVCCYAATDVQAYVLSILTRIDSHAAGLVSSIGGSGSLRAHLVSIAVAAQVAQALNLAPIPPIRVGAAVEWFGSVGDVPCTLTTLTPRS